MRHPRFAVLATLLLVAPLSASSNDKWLLLEAELESLAQAPVSAEGVQNETFEVSGWVRANYANSQNIPAPMSTEDLGGFNMDDVRVQFAGALGNTQMVLSVDGFSGATVLYDAYVIQPLHDNISVTAGQFRVPFLRTALVNSNHLLFIARTRSGVFYFPRNTATRGVMFEATSGPVLIQLAVQNGADILGDDMLLTARVTADIVGQGAGMVEGAYGADDELGVTIGIAISEDQAAPTDEGVAIAAEAAAVWGPFSVQAEAVDYEDDYDIAVLGGRGGTTPYSVTASWMPVKDSLEFAARVDEFDDTLNRTQTTFGLNHYREGGHVKLQVNFRHLESAGLGGDENLVAVGATLGF